MKDEKRFLSLPEYLFDSIAAKIVDGRYKIGQKLVENDLQKEYEVSKSPVREALQMLINLGLVERKARRGCHVKRITVKAVVDNYIVRAVLEKIAAEIAYAMVGIQDLEELKAIYAKMAEAATHNDAVCYLDYHDRFQSFFADKSQNDTLIDFCEKNRMQNLWYRTQYFKVDVQTDLHTHDILLEHLEKRDLTAEEFGNLMQEHIHVGLDNFRQYCAGVPEPGEKS